MNNKLTPAERKPIIDAIRKVMAEKGIQKDEFAEIKIAVDILCNVESSAILFSDQDVNVTEYVRAVTNYYLEEYRDDEDFNISHFEKEIEPYKR